MSICLPKIIGHRGLRSIAPENTIPSIKAALSYKISWVEIDVKLSKDNIPFLLHDDLLDRTTSGRGYPFYYTFNEIKKLNAGSWFNKKNVLISVPSLEEVINYCCKNNLGINIELKPNIGREKQNVESIVKLFQKINVDIQHYFSSFDLYSLILIKEKIPEAFIGYLVNSFTNNNNINSIIKECLNINCFSIGLNIDIVDKNIINICKKNNLIVTIYSDNNIDYNKAIDLWDMGVSSVFIDCPLTYKDELGY